jgi:hypothetical protein
LYSKPNGILFLTLPINISRLSPHRHLSFLKHSNTLLLLLGTLSVAKTMSTTASSLALPSLTPKAAFLCNPKTTSVSLFSLSLSPLRLHCKPISVSASFLHSAPGFHSLSSRFVRNVAVTSEFDQEEELLSDGDQLRFSPDLKLFVGNLPFSVDSAQLAGLFESAGNVEMVEVLILEFGFFPAFFFGCRI